MVAVLTRTFRGIHRVFDRCMLHDYDLVAHTRRATGELRGAERVRMALRLRSQRRRAFAGYTSALLGDAGAKFAWSLTAVLLEEDI